MFSLSQRRYRQSVYGFSNVELCRYMTNGYHCNDIICNESSDFCRSHYNRLQRVIIPRPPINRDIRHIPNLSNNIIMSSNNIGILRNRRMNNDNLIIRNSHNVIIDIDISDDESNDSETDIIINQLQNQKIKDICKKNCTICYTKIKHPLVELHCGCKYHLQCYLLIKEEKNCIKCNDKIYKTDEDLKKCSICLTKIKNSKIRLHCKHEFHNDCLQEWVLNGTGNNTKNCPFCRSKIKLKID